MRARRSLAIVAWCCAAALAPAWAKACPAQPAALLDAIEAVESGHDPLAIHVNLPHEAAYHPPTAAAAIAKAQALLAQGRDLDLGAMGINVRNLGWLHLTLETAFDRCASRAAAAEVLASRYAGGSTLEAQQLSLRRAISAYNTGDERRGFINGYVSKVEAARAKLPDLLPTADDRPHTAEPAALPAPCRPQNAPDAQFDFDLPDCDAPFADWQTDPRDQDHDR